MRFDRKLAAVAAIAFGSGWYLSGGTRDTLPDPFSPPPRDRPVLRLMAKAAKTLLWVAVFADPKPKHAGHHVVQSTIGPDGHEYLDHGDL